MSLHCLLSITPVGVGFVSFTSMEILKLLALCILVLSQLYRMVTPPSLSHQQPTLEIFIPVETITQALNRLASDHCFSGIYNGCSGLLNPL